MTAHIKKADQVRIVSDYLHGLSSIQVAKKHHISSSCVRSIVQRNGYQIRPRRKYKVDESFFDEIDTEEKAYWLGFFSADGSINKNSIRLCLQESDQAHLLKFRSALKSDMPIHCYNVKNSRACSLSIFSLRLTNALAKLGVHPRKSFDLKPAPISSSLASHYWRGLLDGDGSISIQKPNEDHGFYAILVSFAGSREIVSGFTRFVKTITYSAAVPHAKGRIFTVQFGGMTLPQRILSALYNDASVYLDRKCDLAQKALAIPSQRQSYSLISKQELIQAYRRAGSWQGAARLLDVNPHSISELKSIRGIKDSDLRCQQD